jgi:glycerophosphoryl diester phosphodiesterase
MKPEKPKKLGFKKIYLNLDKILFLFFLIFMLVDYIWLPLNSLIAGFLLSQTGYLFISYNNIFAIIKNAPIVSIGFLILIILNLLVELSFLEILQYFARH